jgi:Zn-dependent oligopeptidase
MNKSLFDKLELIKTSLQSQLDTDSQRYLERSITERKLDGLHLDEETRNRVKELKEKISDLQIEFSKNCTEESTKLAFLAEELGSFLIYIDYIYLY